MKIGVTGIGGRMGQAVAKAVSEHELTDLSGAVARKGSALIGRTIEELIQGEVEKVAVSDNLEQLFIDSEAVIDFSSPELALECARLAALNRKILISGTTGFTEEQKQQLISYASSTQIVWSSNMSIGINLLINLVEKVARLLHDDYDVEIFEMHHRDKVDAPSGTALTLGEAVARGRGLNFGEVCRKTREGIVGKRGKKEIGFASLRGGDVIGDHMVMFAGQGERIELAHKASNRDIYARGAIRAAIWASAKKPGFYSMKDVLGET